MTQKRTRVFAFYPIPIERMGLFLFIVIIPCCYLDSNKDRDTMFCLRGPEANQASEES